VWPLASWTITDRGIEPELMLATVRRDVLKETRSEIGKLALANAAHVEKGAR
jgi:hypothetical protein